LTYGTNVYGVLSRASSGANSRSLPLAVLIQTNITKYS
jgi:hypothetical protein